MRKLIVCGLVVAFAFSFAAGAMVSPVEAKPPIPCEYRCINQDWYLCCLYGMPPLMYEVCTFVQYGCELPIID